MKIKASDFTAVKQDVNGNSRHVIHFLKLVQGCKMGAVEGYNLALKIGKEFGGKRFNNKSFGGGIVFQASRYDLGNLCDALNKELNLVDEFDKSTLFASVVDFGTDKNGIWKKYYIIQDGKTGVILSILSNQKKVEGYYNFLTGIPTSQMLIKARSEKEFKNDYNHFINNLDKLTELGAI